MPAILTLQSGAALARSSNLIGAAPAGTRDAHGDAICLDTSTAFPLSGSNKYDLQDPGFATVNVIPDAEYYPLGSGRSADPMTADAFCELGGSNQYHDAGWHQIDLPANGIIVSANALNSVSGNVDILINYLS